MALHPAIYVDQQKIDPGVKRAQKALSPVVVRIRYSLGSDWTGDPSVFFRVVLSDKFATVGKLGEIAEKVSTIVRHEVRPDKLGLHAYFSYRGQAEQEELKEESWA